MNNPYTEHHDSDRVSVLWMVLAVSFLAGMLVTFVQMAQLRKLYIREVGSSAKLQQDYNELVSRSQSGAAPAAVGTILYNAEATPLSVTVPDSYRFVIKDDSIIKRAGRTEIDLVNTTIDNAVLTAEARSGTATIRASQDVFSSSSTADWVKNDSANQVDTTKLVPQFLGDEDWQYLREENNFAGHKLTYFLLKDRVGYRVSFYKLGNIALLENEAKVLMAGIKLD